MNIGTDAQAIAKHVLRVLHVEDDDIDARTVVLFSGLMETYDFQLTRVSSISEAHCVLEDCKFDVCLLDFWVGHENSLKILSTIEQKNPRIPTVVLSNITRADVETLRLQCEGTCFLSKGACSPRTLEYAVRTALRTDVSLLN